MKRLLLAAAAALCLTCVSAASASPDLGIFRDPWQPEAYKGLAVFDGDLIDEQEVYLYLEMTGRDPLLLKGWDDPQASPEKVDLIRSLVDEMLVTYSAASLPEADAYESVIKEEKAAQILASPAAYIGFAENRVRPIVTVQSHDIARYYRENIELFTEPAEIEVRRLVVPLEGSDEAAREAARERAGVIRAQAVAAGGLDEISVPGVRINTATITQGEGDVPETTEAALFALVTSQISQPIEEEDGVVLYEIFRREEAREVPVTQVAEQIADDIFPTLYAQQFDVSLAALSEAALPRNRADYFHLLDPEMELIGVRDFVMSKAEFIDMYPEFADVTTRRIPKRLERRAADIVRGRLVAQAGGANRSSFYLDALDIGERLMRAEFAERHLRATTEPDPEAVAEYARENRELLAPTFDRTLWRLASTPLRPGEMDADERERAAIAMTAAHRRIIAASAELLAERRAVGGINALAFPEPVVNRVIREDPADFNFVFEAAGVYTAPQARNQLGLDYRGLEVGSFSTPRREADGTVVTWYVAEQVARPEPGEAQLLELAERALVEEAVRIRAAERVRELEEAGRLRWKF